MAQQFVAADGPDGPPLNSIDGRQVAQANVPKTQPFSFSGDEGADLGSDRETPVSNDYKQGDSAFTGRISKVTISVK